ncbi:hypothetical protein B0H63DRAFT_246998 [Podospora didyma]|uniref:Uncharacterized protein n=1 Tax=Podospora didyma TaxID=330526 RepID=A0AAE0NCJ6_9PEZI|nr:hypothetical protein B0H63DRAFT_246998 [Podospora didyma]
MMKRDAPRGIGWEYAFASRRQYLISLSKFCVTQFGSFLLIYPYIQVCVCIYLPSTFIQRQTCQTHKTRMSCESQSTCHWQPCPSHCMCSHPSEKIGQCHLRNPDAKHGGLSGINTSIPAALRRFTLLGWTIHHFYSPPPSLPLSPSPGV